MARREERASVPPVVPPAAPRAPRTAAARGGPASSKGGPAPCRSSGSRRVRRADRAACRAARACRRRAARRAGRSVDTAPSTSAALALHLLGGQFQQPVAFGVGQAPARRTRPGARRRPATTAPAPGPVAAARPATAGASPGGPSRRPSPTARPGGSRQPLLGLGRKAAAQRREVVVADRRQPPLVGPALVAGARHRGRAESADRGRGRHLQHQPLDHPAAAARVELLPRRPLVVLQPADELRLVLRREVVLPAGDRLEVLRPRPPGVGQRLLCAATP